MRRPLQAGARAMRSMGAGWRFTLPRAPAMLPRDDDRAGFPSLTTEADARPDWMARVMAGDRRALAQALSALERGTPEVAAAIAVASPRIAPAARRIGFTGPPGA